MHRWVVWFLPSNGTESKIINQQLGSGDFILHNPEVQKEVAAGRRDDIVVMHIFFMSNTFRSFTKSELFGFTEFLCRFTNFD